MVCALLGASAQAVGGEPIPGYRFIRDVPVIGFGFKSLYEKEGTRVMKVVYTRVSEPTNQPARASYMEQGETRSRASLASYRPSARNPSPVAFASRYEPPVQVPPVTAFYLDPKEEGGKRWKVKGFPEYLQGIERMVYILALNIYFESAMLRLKEKNNWGWRAAAGAVFNRMGDKKNRFPKTVEGVITEIKDGIYQFSWGCDNISDVPRNKELFAEILAESRKYLEEYRTGRWVDPINGAHSYHANTVGPDKYFRNLQQVATVAEGKFAHFFYGDKLS